MKSSQLMILTAAWLATAGTSHAQSLRAIPLGSLGGQSAAWNFDGTGRVVCVSATQPRSNLFHPMLSDGVTITDIGALPGTANAFAFAASGDSVFAMSYSFTDLTVRALRWRNGSLSTIGDFAPRGANPAGQVTGFLNTITGQLRVEHACLWNAGTLTDLGTLGGNHSWGYDIDSAGRIVGASTLSGNTQTRPCLWSGGIARDLGTLGGRDGQAYAISDGGIIVGWSQVASGEKHACRWNIDAAGNVLSRTDLGLLSGWSYAYGLNAGGDIVGTSDSKAVLWHGGTLTDLNTALVPGSPWRLDVAAAVDGSGRICGWGTLSGQPIAYVLVCAADINADGTIDGGDFVAFINSFGLGDATIDGAADVNTDGTIDGSDFIAFINAFGFGC